MRRTAETVAPLAALTLLAGVLSLLAQSTLSRDGYRAAYKSWREGDPGLERDAGTSGDALGPRAAKAAAAAAAFEASRLAFLQSMAAKEAQDLQWLRDSEVQPLPDFSSAADFMTITDNEIKPVSASVASLANDPDPAIQQVHRASQRELAALQNLKAAITARQRAEGNAVKAASEAEEARARAMEQYPILASALIQSADLMKKEAAVWVAYYPALAEASKMAAAPPPPPVSAVPAASPVQAASAVQAPRSQSDEASVALRPPSITPLPLIRYVGDWAFQAGEAFHGTEPETVNVEVREENGHATGTFYGRFKLPPGSSDDPVVRFNFSGDFRATRNQRFVLQTSDGLKGTIDLIPGGPFNVLELNFETEIKPGKVHQGDMLLVKQ